MADLRTLVEREMHRAGTPSASFAELERRRQRQHRNHRIFAGVVGAVIGLAAIIAGMSVIRSSPTPANTPTPTTPRAHLAFLNEGVVWERLDTGRLVRVVPLSYVWAVAWSPDGQEVAVEGSRNGACRLQVLTIPSGVRRDLAACDGSIRVLDWSADGRWVAFLGEPDGIPHQIEVVHPDGTGLRAITDQGGFPIVADSLSLSPNGSQIAFGSSGQIYTMDTDGSHRTFLTNGSWPDWSSDGSVIALVRDPHGHGLAGDPFVAQLWTVRPDGSDLTLVHRWPHCCVAAYLSGPALSPDGRRVAIVVLGKIEVLWSDGTHERTIDPPTTYVAATLSWEPVPGSGRS